MTNRISFADIQTSDLLYYDPDIEDICLKFCQERNIDCLPSLDNTKKFYRRIEGGFLECDIERNRVVDCRDHIFDEEVLERFRKDHLLFVFDGGHLSGVVHFSDYNRAVVDAYLFGTLSVYEKSLRRILIANCLTNKDMISYFQLMAESNSIFKKKCKIYERHQAENEKLPEFERFYLDDLIDLVKHKIGTRISREIIQLRNDVMHAHELVYKENPHQEDYIYDFASFEKFFNLVVLLKRDYKKVLNLILFSELYKNRDDKLRGGK